MDDEALSSGRSYRSSIAGSFELADAEVAVIIEAVPARELRQHRVRIDPQMVKQEREKKYCAVT